MRPSESVVVYRGFDKVTLELVENRLRLEGFSPQRLGRVEPALLGAGDAAFEQSIVVPHAQASAALSLIAELQADVADPEMGDVLEELALATPSVVVKPATAHKPFAQHFVVVMLVSAIVITLIYLTR